MVSISVATALVVLASVLLALALACFALASHHAAIRRRRIGVTREQLAALELLKTEISRLRSALLPQPK